MLMKISAWFMLAGKPSIRNPGDDESLDMECDNSSITSSWMRESEDILIIDISYIWHQQSSCDGLEQSDPSLSPRHHLTSQQVSGGQVRVAILGGQHGALGTLASSRST